MKHSALTLSVLCAVLCCGEQYRPTGGPTGQARDVMGITFVEVSAGEFLMGAATPGPPGDLARWPVTAQPKHSVRIAAPFWISTTEVPNSIWERFGQKAGDPDLPAQGVSFAMAEAFCRWMTENAEGTFRLPSEAEWEYCGRAGSVEVFSCGDDESVLEDYAWIESNSGGAAHPVGTSDPNAWGLYDFHGNVMEWVADDWHNNYKGAPVDGSAWKDGLSKRRILRGGSFKNPASHARAGLRLPIDTAEEVPEEAVGIRVVATFE